MTHPQEDNRHRNGEWAWESYKRLERLLEGLVKEVGEIKQRLPPWLDERLQRLPIDGEKRIRHLELERWILRGIVGTLVVLEMLQRLKL